MKGKVAVFTGPRQAMDLREYPVPEVGPDDIVVKVHCANICGSDLHIWRGHGPGFPRKMSIVPGHEMVGEVFRLGKNVQTDCLNRTTEDWHTLVGAILVIAHRKAAHSRANTRFAPTRGLNAVYQCHVV